MIAPRKLSSATLVRAEALMLAEIWIELPPHPRSLDAICALSLKI
jgi:hypothetical protein